MCDSGLADCCIVSAYDPEYLGVLFGFECRVLQFGLIVWIGCLWLVETSLFGCFG